MADELLLPIAPKEMDDFKGEELRVFAPNPRLVKSTQTKIKKIVSRKKRASSKRRVGKQTNFKRNTASKRNVKTSSKVTSKKSRGVKKRRSVKTTRKNGRRSPASVANRRGPKQNKM